MDNFVSGRRAAGGPVAANSLYQVNELGPELLNQGGKTYLMMGSEAGSITPLGPALTPTIASSGGGGQGAGSTVNVSITINSDGSSQMESSSPMLGQFGREIGDFVEMKYRKLLSMDLRPDGAIGRAMQRR
ncbi:hypothetical protein K8374_18255 [Pseudomonas sp. p1(2021b)]|uniref:hypothetical protein n=1 Tax=Pseudomonas sp. p1(2021b) TaxID=2874628 RepID=UPI001CCE9807|nr:hypothetical protein [Pseudomonas sp. p1(2021b)]UBM24298.1 hypothetical protein K8374_18255 [Pseudomonas sp. p1(2021b)]